LRAAHGSEPRGIPLLDLTCLTDILPTGYHGCVNAGVTTGSTVLVSGAGPVGLAAAACAQLLGAAVVIVSDFNKERIAHAASFGCETIDLSQGGTIGERIEHILKVPEVDCAVDCVGFEAKQRGGQEQPATVLNQLMEATREAGRIGIPGLYVTADPGAKDTAAKEGNLSLHFGLGWAKSHAFFTGQTPVLKYNRGLMMAILHDRIQIAKAVNATVITLNSAPEGYAEFDKGVARKFVIDPHGTLGRRA
jgi:glutathione-independent formaldehyde dehydrogenase